jgi:hypothetical protein
MMDKAYALHTLTLNATGKSRANDIAEAFDGLLAELVTMNPETSREMSMVRTKLEEACFFATKAMAIKPENQEPAVP